ncbi:MAG: LacI family DNA-binding transcriptional regulator [Gammaproteobacteria bacterium]|nr:LacI family DNA-binding transcriptional regulator [Gammaproteobacteria bacterium]
MPRKPETSDRNVTIDDIAKAANVSIATVSRALNHPELLKKDTRELVLKIVDELGYIRSGAAMALASNQTFTVGAIIPTFNNAIFAASMAGFEKGLSREGYTLLVTVSNFDPKQEIKQLRKLLERGVDAILLIGLDHPKQVFELLRRSGCCVVSIFGSSTQGEIPGIGFDNAQASKAIVAHLASMGHRRMGMISGITTDNDRARDRKNGVINALQDHRFTYDPALFLECHYSHHHGREALSTLLVQAQPPTAIICGNDVLAMGALFEASSRGIDVPGELSITGFDNLPITEHLRPSLTTIDVPPEEMGIAAARSITDNLRFGKAIESRLLQANLLIRETTGKIAP